MKWLTKLFTRSARKILSDADRKRDTGNKSGAINDLSRAISSGKLNGNELAFFLVTRGAVKTELGEYQGAIEDFSNGIETPREGPSLIGPRVPDGLGDCRRLRTTGWRAGARGNRQTPYGL